MNRPRRIAATAGMLLWVCGSDSALSQQISPPQSAVAEVGGQVTVHIRSQSLRAALRVFADQTQLQVVYRSEQIDPALRCPAVAGTYPAEEALSRLLGASDLRAVRINARTLAVHVASEVARGKNVVVRAPPPRAEVRAGSTARE